MVAINYNLNMEKYIKTGRYADDVEKIGNLMLLCIHKRTPT